MEDEAIGQDGIEVANLIVRDRVARQIQLPQIPQDIQRHDVGDLVIGQVKGCEIHKACERRRINNAVAAAKTARKPTTAGSSPNSLVNSP